MSISIALVGNPNSGKTTLFNALTGSNQYVGNWPGVTVEKKEGKLKKHDDVIITDLPGIYSLSPYSLEEVVSRNYLIETRPSAILNIVDGTNLERNLFLTTQLTELGIPVVVAINMMDVVVKNGDEINIKELEKQLGCRVVEISALKETGIMEAAEAAIEAAKSAKTVPMHRFSGPVEHALAHIEEAALHDMPLEQQRWYAIKIFERDIKVIEKLGISEEVMAHIEKDIQHAEKELDDDAESIITSERYNYIGHIIKTSYKRKNQGKLTTSDKIDRVVTNRWAALPIFALVMFVVYFVSITTVGAWVTDFTNDGLFGDGFFLMGKGAEKYEIAASEYNVKSTMVEAFEVEAEKQGLDPQGATSLTAIAKIYDDNGKLTKEITVTYNDYIEALKYTEPNPADFGTWVPGIPVLVEKGLTQINTADWLKDLILTGIVGGVGAVLGFVPQMLVLFIFLAFLEGCGYMARIAFVMDKIFRKLGLSGKSFIPMLIGTGCGVPGVMASRTIENERDRRMTIITTTFIPCGAKLPIIALIAGALFGGAWWVAPSAYFVGMAAIVVSGIILKKTKLFAGDPAPFVMELPAYHLPPLRNILSSMWERGWSFIKKAGTVILLSSMALWFLQGFGFENGGFGMVENIDNSILAKLGGLISFAFIPLGFGNWESAVASITGLIAKENVVSTFGVLYGGVEEISENGWQVWEHLRATFTPLSAYTFLIFNLLCAPCFAAIGAIRREMNSAKWTLIAIGYQTGFAYAVSLTVYQLGMLFTGNGNIVGSVVAFVILAVALYLLFRPQRHAQKNKI